MNRVVVTGMGVVSPIGNNIEEFTTNLIAGKNGIDKLTLFDTTDYKVKLAAEVKNFEPSQYMTKPEVRKNDRFTHFAVAAASQAIEDAKEHGLSADRIGIYIGSGIGGMNTFYTEAVKCANNPQTVSPYFISMMISNIATGVVSIKYGLKGPSLPVTTACATSSHAIGEAYRAIKHGYADMIVAGGAEAAITPLGIAGFTNCMALAVTDDKDSASIPFDKRRNGFVMGEGAGVLILENYDNAKKRGAKIYGEVIGYGNTSDAFHVTAPKDDAECSSKAIENALKEANISIEQAKDIYINAHGTSTGLNDKLETLAIKKVFNDYAKDLLISSTKSMTGHCLGAAGGIEAIACLYALENSIIPPTIGYKEVDEDCDLNYVPNKAVKKDIKYAVSNSFGFGGHNASVCFKKYSE